jgi:hypothetical protein
MTNVFLPYNLQAQTFAQTLFQTPSGISLVGGSVVFTGDPDAAATFDSLLLGTAQINTPGIFLTSGENQPPLTNTQSGFSQSHFTPGDSDLQNIVDAAFSGAGDTQDAAVLEFKINADPGVKSIIFDVVFGSDEFPEYSNSSYVDIAAILVNGKNAAFFAGNKKKPLSILDDNLGYFQDNTGGGITIEYDGVSNKLTVIAAVKEGENTIKIAIADTGDTIYDSGIFVANLRGSTQALEGILNEIAGTTGNDNLKAVKGIDNILFGDAGSDKLSANNGFDIFYGDESVAGGGEPGKTAAVAASVDEVSAIGDFKDTFSFKSLKFLEEKISKTDVIADFDDLDKINLGKLTGPKLDFIGKDGFSDNGDGEVRYKQFKSKDYTAVYVDTDGDGKTDVSLKILGLHKLNDGDFVL